MSSEQDALTTSLMIILENGDLNPLLCLKPAWLPCFTPILVSWLASSRSKLQTPLRASMHTSTSHTHTCTHEAGQMGSLNGCVEADVMKALADWMDAPTRFMVSLF